MTYNIFKYKRKDFHSSWIRSMQVLKWCIFETKAFYPFSEGLHNAIVIASFYKLFIFLPSTPNVLVCFFSWCCCLSYTWLMYGIKSIKYVSTIKCVLDSFWKASMSTYWSVIYLINVTGWKHLSKQNRIHTVLKISPPKTICPAYQNAGNLRLNLWEPMKTQMRCKCRKIEVLCI